MTEAPGSEGPRRDESWQDRLRSSGMRVTPQREAILGAIRALSHPTPESIHEYLADQTINLSTVYRTLAVLQDVGLITHTHIGSGPPVYHWADDPPHIHLSCLRCHRVTSVPAAVAADFADAVAEVAGFHIDPTHSAVYGLCATCYAAAPPP